MRRPARKLAAALLACASFGAAAVLPTVPAAAEPVRAYGATGLLQAGLGLALVLALIFLFAWVARRFGLQPTGSSRLLKVVASATVGQRERVVVVEIGGTWLVLGVAAGQVSALHTLPAGHASEAGMAATGNGRAADGAFAAKLFASLNKLNMPGKRD